MGALTESIAKRTAVHLLRPGYALASDIHRHYASAREMPTEHGAKIRFDVPTCMWLTPVQIEVEMDGMANAHNCWLRVLVTKLDTKNKVIHCTAHFMPNASLSGPLRV